MWVDQVQFTNQKDILILWTVYNHYSNTNRKLKFRSEVIERIWYLSSSFFFFFDLIFFSFLFAICFYFLLIYIFILENNRFPFLLFLFFFVFLFFFSGERLDLHSLEITKERLFLLLKLITFAFISVHCYENVLF